MHNQDPRQALNQAQNLVQGKGFLGFLTKFFMGKENSARMAAGINQAQGFLDGAEQQARLRKQGVSAQARVMNIVDTGSLVNYDPIVELTLEVMTASPAGPYVAQLRTAVSKIAIPRPGDVVPVYYDPLRPEFVALA